MRTTVPIGRIDRLIFLIRGQKVMLDADLARHYGVPTKRLNEQVRRNIRRFPPDFMFRLTPDETGLLRSQFATLKTGRGKHRKYTPFAFTEQGVAMLSSALNSSRAIRVNIEIMRTFVRLRELWSTNKELAQKLGDLERRISSQDVHIARLFEAMRRLMEPERTKVKRIGFRE
jgi:hypothetical protein